jgi:hypothetical protein
MADDVSDDDDDLAKKAHLYEAKRSSEQNPCSQHKWKAEGDALVASQATSTSPMKKLCPDIVEFTAVCRLNVEGTFINSRFEEHAEKRPRSSSSPPITAKETIDVPWCSRLAEEKGRDAQGCMADDVSDDNDDLAKKTHLYETERSSEQNRCSQHKWKAEGYFRFALGDTVQWTRADFQIPPETTGQVVGFNNDTVIVNFPSCTDYFDPQDLNLALSQGTALFRDGPFEHPLDSRYTHSFRDMSLLGQGACSV